MRTTIQFYKNGCQSFSVHFMEVCRTFPECNTQLFKLSQISIGSFHISQEVKKLQIWDTLEFLEFVKLDIFRKGQIYEGCVLYERP
jgi:hypothetical protein